MSIFFIILAIGSVAVLVGTFNKGKWGINLKVPEACPVCTVPRPRGMRVPADRHEAMWGGWTCKACGTKLDKWGRVRAD